MRLARHAVDPCLEAVGSRGLFSAEVSEASMEINVRPEAGCPCALKRVRDSAPAALVFDPFGGEAVEQSGSIARIERRSHDRRKQPGIEDAERRIHVSAVRVEHSEMPCVMSSHAAVAAPMCDLVSHPIRAETVSSGLGECVRDRMKAYRTCRIE